VRMDKKRFFCCSLCNILSFNYKQAIMHLTSKMHDKKMRSLSDSSIIDARDVLNMVSGLYKKWASAELDSINERLSASMALNCLSRPTCDFLYRLDCQFFKNILVLTDNAQQTLNLLPKIAEKLDNDFDAMLMVQLDAHIGDSSETGCHRCGVS
ncbi:hypothetical protein PFISCL1PPCAC_19179, partial [Pristionchus fissidentatus]